MLLKFSASSPTSSPRWTSMVWSRSPEIADLVRHFDQVIQRLLDGFRRVEGDEARRARRPSSVPTVITMLLTSSVEAEDALDSSCALRTA